MYTRCLSLAAALLALLACSLPQRSAPAALSPTPPALEEAPAAPTAPAPPAAPSAAAPPSAGLISPASLRYLGAFRLPQGGERPLTFAYGGSAMTFYPHGDPQGSADGFSGSLFISGHDRLPYGEMPDGSRIAEVSIPAPVRAPNVADLPTAELLQPFSDVAGTLFAGLDEIPRLAMCYLDAPNGGKIHLAWGQHLEPDPPRPTHAWFDPNLSAPNPQGVWFLQGAPLYTVNGYLFEIPADWAQRYVNGMRLASGRFRDGGLGGMGPALFAYSPWLPDGSAPPNGSALPAAPLLHYIDSAASEQIEGALNGYQHPDEWEGGAWLTTPGGKSAVLLAGTKSIGTAYWYGFVNPQSPDLPCVHQEAVGEFPACRMADGSLCPPQHMQECSGHNGARGWWSTRFEAQFLLYNPEDLAGVTQGRLESWQPQPYAVLNIEEYLYHNPDGVESEMLGTGVQRRFRLGETAYDRSGGRLYVLELFADGAQPVVHVWAVEDT
ncbi:MAG: hypothetical protein HPY45_15455 [Anaerolineae bacterium]|nr:hypothetical protein [Anaerolineae bacterium]